MQYVTAFTGSAVATILRRLNSSVYFADAHNVSIMQYWISLLIISMSVYSTLLHCLMMRQIRSFINVNLQ